MIICVSPNPAIDRRIQVKKLENGAVNRALSVKSFAGGKAAHVAMAAKALGVEHVIWIGFLGGSTGIEIERQLSALGIEVIAVETRAASRINDEIIDENGQITEILEPGGEVSTEEIEEFYAVCGKVFSDADSNFQAVFSGSLPPKAPSDFYKNLILSARENGGQTILDTSGEAFLKGLEAAPDLIKPNSEEVESILNLPVENVETAIIAAERLTGLGGKNIVISLGAEGLIWVSREQPVVWVKPPNVAVVSTVGCGDSTVAGFAVAAERDYGTYKKLRLAVACGAANCLADFPGQISRENVEKLIPLVTLRSFQNIE